MIFEYNIAEEVESRFKRGNQLLFNRDSECLAPLISLIEEQKYRTLVAWAFDYLVPVVSLFEEKYKEERHLSTCMEVYKAWARGEVKIAVARRAILDTYKVAGGLSDKPYGLLAHSVGQGCSAVHCETHGLGFFFVE